MESGVSVDERFHFRLKRLGYGWFNNSVFMFNSVVICFYHCLKGQMIFRLFYHGET